MARLRTFCPRGWSLLIPIPQTTDGKGMTQIVQAGHGALLPAQALAQAAESGGGLGVRQWPVRFGPQTTGWDPFDGDVFGVCAGSGSRPGAWKLATASIETVQIWNAGRSTDQRPNQDPARANARLRRCEAPCRPAGRLGFGSSGHAGPPERRRLPSAQQSPAGV